MILTLQDKEILDEDEEDVLHNVNIKESEKAKENVRNKAKRPGYQAYDEVDEETGELKVRSVLDKYDEEIDGKKTESFRYPMLKCLKRPLTYFFHIRITQSIVLFQGNIVEKSYPHPQFIKTS